MEQLPDVVLWHVSEYCQTADLLNLACVSRTLHESVSPLIKYTLWIGYDTVLGSLDGSCLTKRINTRHIVSYLDQSVFDLKMAKHLDTIVIHCPAASWVRDVQQVLVVLKERELVPKVRQIEVRELDFPHKPTVAFLTWLGLVYENTELAVSLLVRRPSREVGLVKLSPFVTSLVFQLHSDVQSESEDESGSDDYDEMVWQFDFMLHMVKVPPDSQLRAFRIELADDYADEPCEISERLVREFLSQFRMITDVDIDHRVILL